MSDLSVIWSLDSPNGVRLSRSVDLPSAGLLEADSSLAWRCITAYPPKGPFPSSSTGVRNLGVGLRAVGQGGSKGATSPADMARGQIVPHLAQTTGFAAESQSARSQPRRRDLTHKRTRSCVVHSGDMLGRRHRVRPALSSCPARFACCRSCPARSTSFSGEGGAFPLTLAATEGNLVYGCGDRELVNLPPNTRWFGSACPTGSQGRSLSAPRHRASACHAVANRQ